MRIVLIGIVLVNIVSSIRILQQNVGVANGPCWSHEYLGSQCAVSTEKVILQNLASKGPYDLIWLAEVFDERDCHKTRSGGKNSDLACDVYPNQQQIDRIIPSGYTKLCDGHRTCLAVKNDHVVTQCPLEKTCMDGLVYQEITRCNNSQVDISGCSYVDVKLYDNTDVRIIVFHPIAWRVCGDDECFMEYFEAFMKIVATDKPTIVAGDFNFDIYRLTEMMKLPSFFWFLNQTEQLGIRFLNSFSGDVPVTSYVGLITLDFVMGSREITGTCTNLNSWSQRIDYPVLTFDHRGVDCSLTVHVNKTSTSIKEETTIQLEKQHRNSFVYPRHHHHSSSSNDFGDIMEDLIKYNAFYFKTLYSAAPIDVVIGDIWYNLTDVWIWADSGGLPIMYQDAISTQTLHAYMNNLQLHINGSIELFFKNRLIHTKSLSTSVSIQPVLKNVEFCFTFCNDYEPFCYKKNPKKKISFCGPDLCPKNYTTEKTNYVKISNVGMLFDVEKTKIEIITESKFWKDTVDYILKEAKGKILDEIQDTVSKDLPGLIFVFPDSPIPT